MLFYIFGKNFKKMKTKRYFFCLLILAFLSVANAFSSTVDTLNVMSTAMNKQVRAVLITPDAYNGKTEFPVLYLLHGYGDRYDAWIRKAATTKELADRYGIIIVCPDGGFGSWYWDSPADELFRYETFVSRELVAWVDANYKTIASREGRAITGLSMGGHGGLYLGFRHQDVFGACGSMSGGVDIRPFPDNWDMAERLGAQRDFPERWQAHTVMNQLHLLTPNSIRIIIDCGTGDFFYQVNEQLHRELLYRNIPHDYISRPGVHNWQYWNNAVKYQALFFAEYFRERQETK